MHIWNVLHTARWQNRTQKIAKNSPSAHHRTTLSGYIFATKACIDNRKKVLKQQYLATYSYNMVNFGPLAAEIVSLVWGSPANLNGFRVLAALLHGTLVVGVTQILRHWTEGTTCIQQPAITLALTHILVILIFDILGPQNIKRTQLWLRKPFLLSKNLLM